MNRPSTRAIAARAPLLATAAALACAASTPACATVYTDRAAFTAALGRLGQPVMDEDYESRPPGAIANGQSLGDFAYSFDAAVTQPAVASDGNGGLALGGAPNDVFVGGDAVQLLYNGARPLLAFGADYFFAPSFLPPPASIYRMTLSDGTAAGTTTGNGPALDPGGGSFFLGFIEDTPAAFRAVKLYSVVPTDAGGNPFFLDPAYQIDNLVYSAAPAVPEPGTGALMVLGAGALGWIRRRLSAASAQP